MKIRVRSTRKARSCDPDAMIVCNADPENSVSQDQPVVIVEGLSDSTRRVDPGKQRNAGLTIPSLLVLLLVEPDRPRFSVNRRGPDGGSERTRAKGKHPLIPLPDLTPGLILPLRDIHAA